MVSKRIIFMGTPEIASAYLQSLIDINHNVVAVYSQPARKKGRGMHIQESPVQVIAKKNSIQTFTPTEFISKISKKEIEELHPDLIIVMGYGLKLPQYILQLPTLGCFNIHVSLLPRWRGAAPIEHALLNGDKETGVTIFKLVQEMDAGPILGKDVISVDQHMNKKELTEKLNKLGIELLISILPKIFNEDTFLTPQDDSKVTYAHKISSSTRLLDFNNEVKTVYNKIRAFSPRPSAWFLLNNERIKIIKSSLIEGEFEVSAILNTQFHIGCKNGKICPEILQREGKKPVQIEDFLRGFEFIVGAKVNA
jgi:methionyl-tRNA formyltransferase